MPLRVKGFKCLIILKDTWPIVNTCSIGETHFHIDDCHISTLLLEQTTCEDFKVLPLAWNSHLQWQLKKITTHNLGKNLAVHVSVKQQPVHEKDGFLTRVEMFLMMHNFFTRYIQDVFVYFWVQITFRAEL